MQELIKRYFWLLGVITVIVCSTFAAKATGHIIEGKYLGDSKTAPKIAPARPDTAPAVPAHNKDGTQFERRNVFCSECAPPVPVNTDPSSIAVTTLPLQLLATNVITEKPEASYATIVNTENQKQGAYSVNDRMPGASGVIKSIHYQYVDFENNGRIERVVLHGASPSPTPVAAAPAAPSAQPSKDDMQAQIEAGIKKIGDNTYELDKGLMDKVLANPMAWVKGARVVPSVQNGKSNGFKLYAIRPNSAYAKLGLSNGDTISSINGFDLTTADKALEVYMKLREATSLEMEVIRRGKPVTMKYTIR
ncbi:MAG: type II secretion system protein GspC [Kofleriaceae bacterium]